MNCVFQWNISNFGWVRLQGWQKESETRARENKITTLTEIINVGEEGVELPRIYGISVSKLYRQYGCRRQGLKKMIYEMHTAVNVGLSILQWLFFSTDVPGQSSLPLSLRKRMLFSSCFSKTLQFRSSTGMLTLMIIVLFLMQSREQLGSFCLLAEISIVYLLRIIQQLQISPYQFDFH